MRARRHGDTASLEELRKHLGALIHSDRIEFFSDRQIGGGEEWDPAILERLHSAKIIVPLLSPNFLSSRYIQTVEFPTAIARHRNGEVTVLPVLLEACDWEALESDGFKLDRINLLPKDRNNDLKPLRQWRSSKHEAFAQIARRIRNLVDTQER
jgi:TIR domain-containing protein